VLKNIVDGWALNASIRYLPYRATAMLLGQMEPLRRAHNYREQQWVLPEDIRTPIPGRGQLNRQFRMVPNSYLWGATFWEFEVEVGPPPTIFGPTAPVNTSLQITDDATGLQFGSEFINSYSLNPAGNFSTPVLMTQPRLFIKPALLSVEIANLSGNPTYCQLVLYFSEPCENLFIGSQCP
jgi:hypothetical protein